MKKTILFTIIFIFSFSFAAYAQEPNRYSSSRLENLTYQLKRNTVDLADRTSEDLRRGSNNRSTIETAFLAHQLDASAGLFQQMVSDRNNRASDLRDAASILSDLARRAPSYGSNSNLWRSVQNSINDINRELGGNGGYDGGGDTNPVSGHLFWRGTVDDVIRLTMRGNSITQTTMSGRSYPDGVYNFTTPLPRRNVNVQIDMKKGRGDVQVVQQPSRANDYTTVIEIRDRDGGAREYQLDIYW